MFAHQISVSGYVQGVGFRSYVLQTARHAGIVGEAWNSRSGSVEIVAQHADENVLKLFQEEMWNGPGRVDDVRVSPIEVRGYAGFEVTISR